MRLDLLLATPARRSPKPSRRPAALRLGVGTACAVLLLAAVGAAPASADTTIDGPIDLGTAAAFGVLGASAVTNTGPTTITGDVGVSPESAVTGFPPGLFSGTLHANDEVAALAQDDLTTAIGVASSLTPNTQGLGDLTGLSLTPGVYAGGELSLSGQLTLSGTAESVWVFQAASTLVTGTGAAVILTGGASACNVYWRVGSSATLGAATDFVGNIMADQSITAVTGASVEGRLLAANGAVTLDSNVITPPTGCDDGSGSVVTTSPTITSAPLPGGTVGTPYGSTVTSTGSPDATYTVTSGALPPGLVLDSATGSVSGTPTTPGTYTVTITAANGTAPASSATSTIVIAPVTPTAVAPPVAPTGAVDRLPDTGLDGGSAGALGGSLLLLGLGVVIAGRLRTRWSGR